MTWGNACRRIVLGTLLLLLMPCTRAENWPSWRGPRANGTSTATGLPSHWGPGENIRWRLELPGPGPSTPVVWGNRIFLTSADGEDLVLLAAGTDGKLLWSRKLDTGNTEVREGESNRAAPSPVTDGRRVWLLLGTGLLASYDLDGNLDWSVRLPERYGELKTYFGLSASPLLHGGRIYLQLLNTNGQIVVALDAATGAEVWSHERGTDARAECLHSYATPVMVTSGGKDVLLTHGADYLVAHDPSDGRELWRVGGLQDPESYNPTLRLVATPAAADGLLVVPSAKNGPVLGLDLSGPKPVERWRLDHGTPDVPSPALGDGLVYLSRENGFLTVVDAGSGEITFHEKVHPARHRGSPLLADGKLYLMGMDGTVTVLRAGRRPEILASNEMGERLAASLAVAGDLLLLRTYAALYAIGKGIP